MDHACRFSAQSHRNDFFCNSLMLLIVFTPGPRTEVPATWKGVYSNEYPVGVIANLKIMTKDEVGCLNLLIDLYATKKIFQYIGKLASAQSVLKYIPNNCVYDVWIQDETYPATNP